jgi:hypothetical protein
LDFYKYGAPNGAFPEPKTGENSEKPNQRFFAAFDGMWGGLGGGTVLLRYCYGIYPEDAATKCSFLIT